jgi:hypothetical protein
VLEIDQSTQSGRTKIGPQNVFLRNMHILTDTTNGPKYTNLQFKMKVAFLEENKK